MRLGVLGSGDVAKALAAGKLRDGLRANARSSAGSFADAANFGDVRVLAVKGPVAAKALRLAGTPNLVGTSCRNPRTPPQVCPAHAGPQCGLIQVDSGRINDGWTGRSPRGAPVVSAANLQCTRMTCPLPEADAVCAVIVSWRPDAAVLSRLLDALLPQVAAIVIVDNASGPAHAATLHSAAARGCTLLEMAQNLGLAAGFNRGIAQAREQGLAWVLLLDQDSVPAPDMVAHLQGAVAGACGARPVAAAGPNFIDPRDGRAEGFVRFGWPRHRRLPRLPGSEAVECDHLISSGCLLRLGAVDAIGAMDERLFIDNVDLEWGMRARARGYALIGVWEARLEHHLGDSRRRLFPLLPLQTAVHGPVRLYYMMRNRVLLYRRPPTPRRWVLHDLPRVPLKFLVFALLVPPRWQNARWMLRGIVDALRGRHGPAPGS